MSDSSSPLTEFDEAPPIVASGEPLLASAFLTPLAILIGALVIAGSIVISGNKVSARTTLAAQTAATTGQPVVAAPQPPQPDPNERVTVSTEGRPSLGRPDAKVTVVEFSDLQCPFCKRFHDETFSQFKATYIDTGKVRFVYRHFPLTQIHPFAEKAAEAAECAAKEGKFWEMHDAVFAAQPEIGTENLKAIAKTIGLSTQKFTTCLDSGETKPIVDKDTADGSALSITGTPTFFVNGRRIVGAQPFSVFQQAIDSALAS